jgi:DNA-binding FadR family transcriptional regulator
MSEAHQPRRQLRQPRLAELVADQLRAQITSGRLREGDLLPKQEELLERFRVSKPSLREALRILETEGLITVRRGNVGGAVVHPPGNRDAGYMIGLVLESRGVELRDVAEALVQLEPMCAALCAERADRSRTVLPVLAEINERTRPAVDDPVAFTGVGREFHEALVSLCGNDTLIVIVGALEALWSARERHWALSAYSAGEFPEAGKRLEGLRSHERILELIEKGDSSRVERLARRHLEAAQTYAIDSELVVQAAAVRGLAQAAG